MYAMYEMYVTHVTYVMDVLHVMYVLYVLYVLCVMSVGANNKPERRRCKPDNSFKTHYITTSARFVSKAHYRKNAKPRPLIWLGTRLLVDHVCKYICCTKSP